MKKQSAVRSQPYPCAGMIRIRCNGSMVVAAILSALREGLPKLLVRYVIFIDQYSPPASDLTSKIQTAG